MSSSSYDEMTFKMEKGKLSRKLSRNQKIILRAMKKGKAKERLTKEFMRAKAKKAKRSENAVYYREKETSDILPETAKLYEQIEEDSDMNEFVKMMEDQYDQMQKYDQMQNVMRDDMINETYYRMMLDYLRDEEEEEYFGFK